MSEQFGWSEWIEFKAGVPCPITWAKAGQYEVKWDEGDGLSVLPTSWEAVRFWRSVEDPFHYRYSLSAAPAGFAPPGAEKPWYPPVPEGFGPWVEYDGAERFGLTCRAAVLYRHEREAEALSGRLQILPPGGDYIGGTGVVAIALECLEDQPTQEQVEATQKPETPQDDALDDEDPDNLPMFTHDAAGIDEGCWTRFNARQAWQKPTPAPGAMVSPIRSSDGLLTVRGSDHRLGLWE